MKGKALLFAFAFVLALGTVWRAPLAAQDLLSSSVGTWTASGTPTQVPAQQIEQLANERANILREYGITSGERRDYTTGNDKITVTLYRMVDPSAAFGAFTFFRDPDMALPAPIMAASYAAGKRGRELLVQPGERGQYAFFQLAYHVAVYRGTDVDQPRNLAKSVTVE